jgi:hypothetical protein
MYRVVFTLRGEYGEAYEYECCHGRKSLTHSPELRVITMSGTVPPDAEVLRPAKTEPP